MAAQGRDAADRAGVEVGSFRDPDSRVFVTADGVFRALGPQGLDDWRALSESPLLEELIGERLLVDTDRTEPGAVGDLLVGEVAAVLRHERIPFVSYPYEWTFSMLRDAALLQLDLIRRALRHDLMLKDASAYNVQWRGCRPVFIDAGSFERLRPGEPWVGYRQFCMLFLYPLMLQAYKDVPFQPWLRGSVDGISPSDAAAVMSLRDRLRRGVLSHVVLHARLERRYSGVAGRDVKREMRRAGFGKELLDANVRRLEKLVRGLEWQPGETAWTGYRGDNTYTDDDALQKAEFVRSACERRPGSRVWDIGCNDGTYSRVAAESAREVIAIDADHATVDGLYRALRDEGADRILPLVMSVTDPSPDLGWRGRERSSLERRGAPDLALCLAVVHHVSIAGNVPLRELLAWLRSLDCALVIEFPDRADPMVQRLLAGKRDEANPDYDRATFERLLGELFDVERSIRLSSGTRTLFEASPRV